MQLSEVGLDKKSGAGRAGIPRGQGCLMMMILSTSPSSSDDDDRVIITIIISGGGCRGRKHAWKLGVLVISLFLDRTQKPYLLSVVEIVGELKPKG